MCKDWSSPPRPSTLTYHCQEEFSSNYDPDQRKGNDEKDATTERDREGKGIKISIRRYRNWDSQKPLAEFFSHQYVEILRVHFQDKVLK